LRKAVKSIKIGTSFQIDGTAEKLGFSNITHVFRFFRQEAQISPQAFRKQYGRPRDAL
jgi:AraC-like DNA-binding protein